MDSGLEAQAGHEGGAAGGSERKDCAASLAAAPAKQRSPCFGADVGHSRFAAFPAADVDCARMQVDIVPV